MRKPGPILLAALLAAALLAAVLLTGCGGQADQPQPAPPTDAAETQPSEPTPDTDEPEEDPLPEELPPAPVYAHQIADGTYPIEVSSSSSMFRIVDAQLTVDGDAMSAVLTLSGTGYEKLYPGTGEQALEDSDDRCIYYAEDAQGKYTYEVPVEALNREIDVAAWSIRKQSWYDRVLVFGSAQIPPDALTAS